MLECLAGGLLFAVLSSPPSDPPAGCSPIALLRRGDRVWVGTEEGELIAHDLASLQPRDRLRLDGIRRVADWVEQGSTGLVALIAEPPGVLFLDEAGGRPRPGARLELPGAPVAAATIGDATWFSCPSSRCLVQVLADETGARRVARERVLDFDPGELLWLPSIQRLLVADRHGGRWASVDAEAEVDQQGVLRGHSIGALRRVADTVWIAHSKVGELAHATREDVHWGTLARHEVLEVPVQRFATGGTIRGRSQPLGDIGEGAADPVALVRLDDETRAVACAGSQRVEIQQGARRERIETGEGPCALYFDAAGERLWVAERWSGTVGILQRRDGRWQRIQELRLDEERGRDRTVEEARIARGRRLFHDARLSHDGWMSCHTCHVHGDSSGRRCDTQSDGSLGTPKRIPGLGGVRDTAPYGWSGTFTSLEQQVRKTLSSTMHQDRPARDDEVEALVAYLRSLPPPSPLPPARRRPADEGSGEARATAGARLFQELGCADCHEPGAYTSPSVYDVGLRDEAGLREYNPPSLRGVSRRQRFFHDGRAASLDEVLGRHAHPDSVRVLDDGERAALVAFLREL